MQRLADWRPFMLPVPLVVQTKAIAVFDTSFSIAPVHGSQASPCMVGFLTLPFKCNPSIPTASVSLLWLLSLKYCCRNVFKNTFTDKNPYMLELTLNSMFTSTVLLKLWLFHSSFTNCGNCCIKIPSSLITVCDMQCNMCWHFAST